MAEHTEGPLRQDAKLPWWVMVGKTSNSKHVALCEGIEFSRAVQVANAERIVAAWNATLGIPTATLEALGEGGLKRIFEAFNHSLTKIFEDFDEDEAARWRFLLDHLDDVLLPPKEQGDAQ